MVAVGFFQRKSGSHQMRGGHMFTWRNRVAGAPEGEPAQGRERTMGTDDGQKAPQYLRHHREAPPRSRKMLCDNRYSVSSLVCGY
jgi:hypothetical protein